LYNTEDKGLAWLKFLSEDDTRLALQLRNVNDGTVISEYDIRPRTFVKPGADLIVMHLEDEPSFLADIQERSAPAESLRFTSGDIFHSPEKKVVMVGHDFKELLAAGIDPTHSSASTLTPIELDGELNLQAGRRFFVRTETPSMMGLCGGPVFFRNGDPGEVLGMVEALVHPLPNPLPAGHAISAQQLEVLKRVQGNTVVLPAAEIAAWVHQVEEELAMEE